MASRKVEVQLIVNSDGVVTGIKSADGELLRLKQTTEQVDDRTKRLSTSMKVGLASALIAVGAAARSGFRLLSESVQLAGVQQIAERKLEQALRNTGDASEASAKMLKDLASEVQGFSNFGDEAVITAQAMLLSFGEVGGARGAALLTPRLADLAAGVAGVTGNAMDLNQAASLLGKSLTSGAGALSRVGISLTKAQEAAFNAARGLDRVNVLAEIVDSNFRGLAEATADPFIQMGNAISDLKEKAGLAVRGELTQLADKIKEITKDPALVNFAQATGVAFGTVVTWVLKLVEAFGHFSNIIRSALRFSILQFREFQGVVTSVSGSIVDTLSRMADAVGLESLADRLRGMSRELQIRKLVIDAQAAGERKLIADILSSADAIKRQTDAINDNTDAVNVNNAAISRPVRPQIETARRTDIELEPDRLDLGDPLEAFDINSIAAVEEAIANLRYQLDRVASDESRAAIGAEIDALNVLRDSMEDVANTAQDTRNKRVRAMEDEARARQAMTDAYAAHIEQSITSDQMSVESAADAANAVIGSVTRVIKAKMGEAIAKMLASLPFPSNILLGGIAAVGINAIFDRLIPKFADGVRGFGGGLAIVGDDPRRGGTGELVSLPRGSDVYSASDTRNILSNLSRLQDRAPVSSDAAIGRQTEVLTASLQGLGDRIAEMRVQMDLVTLRDAQNRQDRKQRAFGNTAG